MPTILLFDDDEAQKGEIISTLRQLVGDEVAGFVPDDGPEEGVTYEQHVERKLSAGSDDSRIGLIACDKELGRFPNYPGLSANAISVVARNLGIPFCQYSRHPKAISREIDRYNALRRWDSEEITLTGSEYREWAEEIAELWRGFEMIRKEYARPEIAALKPASALASIMGRDAAKSRISLYGSGDQSVLTEILAFVADGDEVAIVQRLPRVLGT